MNAPHVAFVLLVAACLANVTQLIVIVVVRTNIGDVKGGAKERSSGRFFFLPLIIG